MIGKAVREALDAALDRDEEQLDLAVSGANALFKAVRRVGWRMSAKRLSSRRVLVCLHVGGELCHAHEVRGRHALREARAYVLGVRAMAVMAGQQIEG